jgi:hypothetical protein
MNQEHRQPLPQSQRRSRLKETWQDFNRALRSVREPFNPFAWILRLFLALVHHIYISTGLAGFCLRHDLHRRRWRACIPIFAMCLIGLVILSYPLSIRHRLIQPRWCSSSLSSSLSCKWMYLHDFIVFYLGFMVLYHYIATIFTSPGVALPSSSEATTTTTSPPPPPPTKAWTAIQSQGGILGWNAVCNIEQERQRVQLYGPLSLLTTTTTSPPAAAAAAACDTKKSSNSNKNNNNNHHDEQEEEDEIHYFPSVQASYCEKCQIIRPPRCHHCNVCHRCILQYDHHCIWVNSCTLRCFLLTCFCGKKKSVCVCVCV